MGAEQRGNLFPFGEAERKGFRGLRGNEWVKRGAESVETRSGSGRKHWGGGPGIGHDRRMRTSPRPRRLWDTYRFPGFCPRPTVTGIFGDPHARIITLTRRSKKPPVGPPGGVSARGTTANGASIRL